MDGAHLRLEEDAVKPEHLQLALAMVAMGYYIYTHEVGKVLYWGGVIVLTFGLLIMKG